MRLFPCPAPGCLLACRNGVNHNDVMWHDTAGNEIWCNGGHIIREGQVFYRVDYDTGPGRWPWRINRYSSTNRHAAGAAVTWPPVRLEADADR